MKILITHEIFPPERAGGGETVVYKTAKELIKKGHTVKVLTTGSQKIKKYDGIQTIRVPVNRYLMNLSFPIIAYHARDVDIIQTSSGNMCFPSWVAAKVLNKPISCYVHHIFGPYWKDVRGGVVGRVFQTFEKFFLSRSYDAVVFQNKSSMKLGLDIGVNKKIIRMLQPGIDHKKFQNKKTQKEQFVLFVGNLDMNKTMVKIKGLDYLIEAARQTPDVKFFVVGGGSHLEKLKNEAPSNVTFTGPLVGKPLLELYSRSSIFCLTSLSEGFGLSVLEAMASGCAIVSTIDIGQKGILIKPKRSKDIVRAVNYLIKNKKQSGKMGNENRNLAKKFTWNSFSDKLVKVYEEIIQKKG